MVLNASLLSLTQICYDICYEQNKLHECFDKCVFNYISSRKTLKKYFFGQIQRTQKENEAVKNSYYN